MRPGVDSPPIWKSYLRRNIFLLPPNLNSVSTLSDHAHIGGQHLRPESLVMNYGYNPAWSEEAIKPTIFQTSTFVFKNAEEGKSFFELAYGLRQANPDEEMGLIYSRLNNPSLEILENRLCLWDGAEEAASFASGMAAISTSLLALLQPGDVVLLSEPVYGGSRFLPEKRAAQVWYRSRELPAYRYARATGHPCHRHRPRPPGQQVYNEGN